ncbi:hypothetical protein [Wolbachia endosymbiont of Brugia pahangi]|uniref:hypothetical protein n=1 Tax=Wolbachia endosymbiont of Brugia pahangi TaxID=96495 RepID=UPI00143AAA2B|nr:hypothetical protein [Wolbachia endosymbiont of Brugia pahangi]
MKNSKKCCTVVTVLDFSKTYGRFRIYIALNPKISHHLTRLAEVTKEAVQELAKRLITEGIECKIEGDYISRCYYKKRI